MASGVEAGGREFYDDGYDSNEDDDSIGTRIKFDDSAFCGRDQELQRMEQVFSQHYALAEPQDDESNPEQQLGNPTFFVSGQSGCGKTALVQRLVRQHLEPLAEKGGIKPFFFLSGKYEELERDPYSAIVDAFNGFFGSFLAEKAERDCQTIRRAIMESLGDELPVLLNLMPGLIKLFDKDPTVDCQSVDVENTQNRLLYLFRLLVKAICNSNKVLILFLDDVQWMDSASLNLLCSLVREQGLPDFVVIGAFRSDEVRADHVLSNRLEKLQEEVREVISVDLRNLTMGETRVLIKNVLELEEDDNVDNLTKAIFSKTRGNPFFVRQAMEELHRKSVVYFSRISFRWEWNEAGLDQLVAGISDDVLDAVVAKLQALPPHLQRALVLASLTRSIFDTSTLFYLLETDGSRVKEHELSQLLDEAVLEGILSNTVGSRYYSFAHDSFQEAAASLVPKGPEQERTKLMIGHALYKRASRDDIYTEEWMLFVAADHFNSMMITAYDPEFLARMNMECGEKAILVAAFLPSSRYFQKGIEALRKIDRHWESHYDLSLRLYRGLSNVNLSLGLFEQGGKYANELLEHAESLDDKIPTLLALAAAFGKMERHREGFELCLSALVLRGVYPRSGVFLRILGDYWSVKRQLMRQTDDEILKWPTMTDAAALSNMALIMEAGVRGFQCGYNLYFLLGLLRGWQISFKHGHCGYSPTMFAGYGLHLMAVGDVAGAMRMAGLTRKAIFRVQDKRREGFALFALAAYLEGWTDPHYAVLETLKVGHKSAMEVGDIEAGFRCWTMMNFHAYVAGYPLDRLEWSGREVIDQMRMYRVDSMLGIFLQVRFPIVVLTGRLGHAIDWEGFTQFTGDLSNESELHRAIHFYLARLELAIYFRKFALGVTISKLLPSLALEGYAWVAPQLFFTGLAHAGMAKQSGKRKHILRLGKVLDKVRKIVDTKCPKMRNKLELLEAEWLAVRNRNATIVKASYDTSIATALKAEHIQDAALANECAGEHFLKEGQFALASSYYSQAHSLYEKWGARLKTLDLEDRLGHFLSDEQGTNGMGIGEPRSLSGITKRSTGVPKSDPLSTICTDLFSHHTPPIQGDASTFTGEADNVTLATGHSRHVSAEEVSS